MCKYSITELLQYVTLDQCGRFTTRYKLYIVQIRDSKYFDDSDILYLWLNFVGVAYLIRNVIADQCRWHMAILTPSSLIKFHSIYCIDGVKTTWWIEMTVTQLARLWLTWNLGKIHPRYQIITTNNQSAWLSITKLFRCRPEIRCRLITPNSVLILKHNIMIITIFSTSVCYSF